MREDEGGERRDERGERREERKVSVCLTFNGFPLLVVLVVLVGLGFACTLVPSYPRILVF